MTTTIAEATTMILEAFPGAEIIDDDDTSHFDWALRYSTRGWRTVPLERKNPKRFGKGWQHRASADPLRVVEHFQPRWVDGVGIVVPENIAVVDIDPRNGGDMTWGRYVDVHGEPDTLTSVSGRNDGGRHYYFQRPERRLRDVDGIDVKTSGMVAAPPTVHPATGDRYWWVNWGAPVAPMPDSLVDLLARPTPAPSRESTTPSGASPRVGDGMPSVLDAYAVLAWSEIWPDGWKRAVDDDGIPLPGTLFDEPAELWCRPGGASDYSAKCGARWCHVFSTMVPGLPVGAYSKAQVFAWANNATVKQLAKQTYQRMQEVRRVR